MKPRHWLGLGLFALCLGTGFVEPSSNSALAIVAVLSIAVSLLVPQAILWIAYAFWGGIFATFGVYVYLANIVDAELTSLMLLGIAAGLGYMSWKAAREAQIIAKLTVWVPVRQWTWRSAVVDAKGLIERSWGISAKESLTSFLQQFRRAITPAKVYTLRPLSK